MMQQTDIAVAWPPASERASFQSKKRLSVCCPDSTLTPHLGSDCVKTQRQMVAQATTILVSSDDLLQAHKALLCSREGL